MHAHDKNEQWQTICRNKKKSPKKDSINNQSTFQIIRPHDPIVNTDNELDYLEDEHEEKIKLENPLFWNQFALIGNITKRVNELLLKYQIFPQFQIMKLFRCINKISKNITKYDLDNDFDNIMSSLNRKIVFVSVIPRFTEREYGTGETIYMIHIRFNNYLMADSRGVKYNSEFLYGFEEYDGFLGETPTHIPITNDSKESNRNRENFLKVMKIVKDKRETVSFQLDCSENEENNGEKKDTKVLYYAAFKNEQSSTDDKLFKCKLFLQDAHSGYGEILDGNEKGNKIYLHNRRNCGKAFCGDIVNILVFRNSPNKNDQWRKKHVRKDFMELNKLSTGRVVSVVSSEVKPINKIFLCHLLNGTTNLMTPICNTIPVIYVDNKRAIGLTRKHCKNLREMNVVGIPNIIQNTIPSESTESFANKTFVTLKELHDNLSTSVRNVYHVDCYTCEYIFLVLFRKWDDYHRFPYGEVVGIYTPDVEFEKTLNIIKVTCDMTVIGIEEELPFHEEIAKIKKLKMNELKISRVKKSERIIFSFTHPNKEYNETAFSFKELPNNGFEIGVHVANVCKYIQQEEFLDKISVERFFTFLLPDIKYSSSTTLQSDYLLSKALSNEYLSINLERPTDVISFCFKINEDLQIIESDISTNDIVVLDLEIDVKNCDNLIKSQKERFEFLRTIHTFCSNHARYKKHVIPADCFCSNFQLKINQSAYIIEEVLKQLTNEKVMIQLTGERTLDGNMNLPINVKRQLQEWYERMKQHCNVTLAPIIKQVARKLNANFINNNSLELRASRQFLDEALNCQDVNPFQCESLFPDIGFYHSRFELISNVKIGNYLEQLDARCLSVTNPLSCYLDIFTQRVLLDRMNGSNADWDIEEYLDKYQTFKIVFDKYWKICRAYEIKDQFNGDSFIFDCVFEGFTEEKVYFQHPFLNEVNHENFILFRLLGLNKIPLEKPNDDSSIVVLNWKTRIFIYSAENCEEFQNSEIDLKDIYSYYFKIWRYKIITSEIETEDIESIEEILNENHYPKRLTSEIIENINPVITLKQHFVDRQLMRIQFGYDYTSGIMKIVPELMIINPDFRVCLCHRSDPFKYFMHSNELNHINYKRFKNLSEYKSQFIILIRIEGIHQAISSNVSFSIHDLKVDWISKRNNNNDSQETDIYGIVIIKKNWTESRFIKLTHEKTCILDPVNALREAVEKNKMDYLLCIQTFIADKNIYWVGHGRVCDTCLLSDKSVSKKKSKDYDIHLTFKLVHSNFPIKNLENQQYLFEFMESPISTRIFERSLRKLQKDTFSEELVIEKVRKYYITDKKFLDYERITKNMLFSCNLNSKQKMALESSANLKFTLIWGPPGTGKTLVGCMIAYWYTLLNKTEAKSSSVLYCGPSNQSVNVVAEKLMKTFGPNCPKLLRIFNSDIMFHDFPCAGGRDNPDSEGCPEYLRDIALHYLVRKPGKPYAEKLNEYQAIFATMTKRSQGNRKEFAKIFKAYNTCLKRAFQKELENENYEIILTTAAGSCKKLLDLISVTQIIVDECGMCSEPETLGPTINKNDLKHLVLIGDHKQLRPIVTSRVAKGKQLNKSLFERLYKPAERYCIMLDTQYRMHPSICEFPSVYFYRNSVDNRKTNQVFLTTAVCESWTGIPDTKHDSTFNGLQYVNLYRNYKKDLKRNNISVADEFWEKGGERKLNFKCLKKDIDFNGPSVYEKILFIHTQGHENNQEISCSTGSNQSKSNDLEAEVVKYLYKKLLAKIVPLSSASHSILVITQYRLQEHNLNIICQKILEDNGISESPRVSTVVKSQGSECDYVIFSTVRSLPNIEDIDKNPTSGWISKYLGFITDENQFNVALTRARKGLFIVGNSHLLSVNDMWKDFINDLKRRNCFKNDILELF